MLGSSILSSRSTDSRVFVYEVTGLRQSDQTVNNNHEIRHSDTMFVQVPFSRMNEFMQQIDRSGARIVNIRTNSSAGEEHKPEHEGGGKKKKG
jgi:phycocyanin-associated, rod